MVKWVAIHTTVIVPIVATVDHDVVDPEQQRILSTVAKFRWVASTQWLRQWDFESNEAVLAVTHRCFEKSALAFHVTRMLLTVNRKANVNRFSVRTFMIRWEGVAFLSIGFCFQKGA